MTEKNQIDVAERYREASEKYYTELREYIDSVVSGLEDIAERMDMSDPFHADALRSFTWGLVREVRERVDKIGKDYSFEVASLRDSVVGQE